MNIKKSKQLQSVSITDILGDASDFLNHGNIVPILKFGLLFWDSWIHYRKHFKQWQPNSRVC